MESKEIPKLYNFSSIKFSDLEKIIKIQLKLNPSKFDDWLGYSYAISEDESIFLNNLLQKYYLHLPYYMEEDLKVKFLSPILSKVNFMTEDFDDWYHASLGGEVNGVEIKGFVDYMVATGTREPNKPYFFIQEFKPSIPDKDPEVQLLAELLVAIEKNKSTIIRGGYIIGQYWKFVILEKLGENQFEYVVSKSFDSLDLEDLKQIYVILQAVKHKYCKD